ncbi:bifunctional serine/threonine-protein kinase/formylglycine-generating enzyme family protein [Myxococcota bacterium]|nr:bifunctional serine/threonine-protein kinase/formylglycine-generating enzyme family protein [Myxococcota bacterium]
MHDETTWSPDGGQAESAPVSSAEERYHDLGLIARGGMGEVRRVWDQKLRVPVAMKVLGWELLDSTAARARFLGEIATTARLQHPGVVSVMDRGQLHDGRLWFTMTLVEGKTLGEMITGPAVGPEVIHRLVTIVRSICDAVGYAHSRGVLHRDLKPANLMVGRFGEVRVMDWGLARWIGTPDAPPFSGAPVWEDAEITLGGAVLGTPAFMSPEQARGQHDLVGTASDVYALGGVLHSVLCGRAPLEGDPRQVWRRLVTDPPRWPEAIERPEIPAELRQICGRALMPDPIHRYPNAGALGEALSLWLDGSLRRAEALALTRRAEAMRPAIVTLKRESEALRARASSLLESLAADEPVESKLPIWEMQDRAAALESEVTLREVAWHQDLRAALNRDPELPEAHALLADHYRDELERADRQLDPLATQRAELLLASHDRGRYAAYLRGDGVLTLRTSRPAIAWLHRFVERGRRMVTEPERLLGVTPLVEVSVPRGSWLVTLEADGVVVRYPVLMERAGRWDGVPPEGGEPALIMVPTPGQLRDDQVYIPPGYCIVGGDPFAADSLPRQRVWVDGFVIGRFPVTLGEYAKFLEALIVEGDEAAVEACWPWYTRKDQFLVRDGARVLLCRPDDARVPVTSVSWAAAAKAAEWFGGRLPNELEIEKAGRGVDGRYTPWGRELEPRWSRVLGSLPTPPRMLPVGAFPADESPYGVRDLAGNARIWCRNWWSVRGPIRDGRVVDTPDTGTHRAARGGFYGSPPMTQRLATRFGNTPDRRIDATGLRVVWPSPQPMVLE